MIKVNLLREQTVKVHHKIAIPTVSSMGLVLLAIFALCAVALGGWWYFVNGEVNRLTVTRGQLQIESVRLQELRKQLAEYEKLKKLRENRIQVIEKLKEAQTGPVQLLNALIRCIPGNSNMWLTQVDQKGERIQIVGFAGRSESIPDFMINLSASGLFKSVDLELVQEDKDASKFSLICMSPQKVPKE
jgi:Tfp pilus assembly protein PilN